VVSGAGADTFNAAGAAGPVEVYAGGGNDTVTGGAGNDVLWGLDGKDTLAGKDGDDVLLGNAGADSLSGGLGNDRLYVDTDDILIDGGIGFDAAYITAGTGITLEMAAASLEWVADFVGGNDTIDATAQTVRVEMYMGGGADELTGGLGDDLIFAGTGDDAVQGGAGADALFGEEGADSLAGGVGDDRLFFDSFDTLVDGGAGFDAGGIVGGSGTTLDMAAAALEWLADFVGGDDVIDASGAGTGVQMYMAGGSDSLTGGAGSDLLFGGAGNDVLSGNGGADALVGEAGADSLSGGAGNDRLYIDSDDSLVDGGADFDAAYFAGGAGVALDMAAANVEFVQDTVDGADAITGVGTGMQVFAGGGDDTIGITDSAFATIAAGDGLDRLALTSPGQNFDLTANAAKVTGLEVISLNDSVGAALSLTDTDIPQINAAGNSLYALGGVDDTINIAGNDWVVISTTHTNPAISNDVFVHLHSNATNSDLYFANTFPFIVF
jgi:Ca2+-binding RTX toxin-like protein